MCCCLPLPLCSFIVAFPFCNPLFIPHWGVTSEEGAFEKREKACDPQKQRFGNCEIEKEDSLVVSSVTVKQCYSKHKQMEWVFSILPLFMMNKKIYAKNKRIICLSNSSPHNKQIKKQNSFVPSCLLTWYCSFMNKRWRLLRFVCHLIMYKEKHSASELKAFTVVNW